jgi:hypothetical protein
MRPGVAEEVIQNARDRLARDTAALRRPRERDADLVRVGLVLDRVDGDITEQTPGRCIPDGRLQPLAFPG